MQRWLPVVLLHLWLPCISMAQTATAPVAEPPPRIDRWSFGFDIGFNGQTGNTDVAILTSGLRVTHLQKDQAEFEWAVSYRYGKSGSKVVAEQLRSSLKFDLHPQDVWTPFVFTQVEHNPIVKIDVRSSGGAGIKYTFRRAENRRYALSVAGLYSYESFTDDRALSPNSVSDPRVSWRMRIQQPIGDVLQIEQSTFYQPVFDRASDYDIDAATSATARLTRNIGLGIEHQYRHDSTPREGILRDDHIVTVGLKLKL